MQTSFYVTEAGGTGCDSGVVARVEPRRLSMQDRTAVPAVPRGPVSGRVLHQANQILFLPGSCSNRKIEAWFTTHVSDIICWYFSAFPITSQPRSMPLGGDQAQRALGPAQPYPSAASDERLAITARRIDRCGRNRSVPRLTEAARSAWRLDGAARKIELRSQVPPGAGYRSAHQLSRHAHVYSRAITSLWLSWGTLTISPSALEARPEGAVVCVCSSRQSNWSSSPTVTARSPRCRSGSEVSTW